MRVGLGAVPGFLAVTASQPTGDISYKLGGRLLLLTTRPAITLLVGHWTCNLQHAGSSSGWTPLCSGL